MQAVPQTQKERSRRYLMGVKSPTAPIGVNLLLILKYARA